MKKKLFLAVDTSTNISKEAWDGFVHEIKDIAQWLRERREFKAMSQWRGP